MIYKNNIVAIYDQNENCVFVADTWQELAEYLGKSIKSTQSSMSHIIKKNGGKQRRRLLCNGKMLTPYLIELEEDE